MSEARLFWTVMAAGLLISTSSAVVTTQGMQHQGHDGIGSHGSLRGPLPEAVRRATERFRDVNEAIAAGYVQFQGCVSGPDEGAMGVHYSNFSLFDDKLDVLNPEVLVYEPRNGRLHLVAAEYVTPAAAWEPSHEDFDQPTLMGHLFHYAAGPNRYGPSAIYELHVWAWKANPRGTFADWNPSVSCNAWESSPIR
jgi:hypothetical protein